METNIEKGTRMHAEIAGETPKPRPRWVDATSYSQGDRDRKPTAWRFVSPLITIAITKSHIDYKGEWVVTCHPYFKQRQLLLSADDTPAEVAQDAAFELVRDHLKFIAASLENYS